MEIGVWATWLLVLISNILSGRSKNRVERSGVGDILFLCDEMFCLFDRQKTTGLLLVGLLVPFIEMFFL